MAEAQADFPEINRVVHEPARLAILTVLSSCRDADFVFLQRVTALSKGNLSVQLTKLAEAGLVDTRRTLVRRKTRTTVQITARGEQELKQYWEALDRIKNTRFGPA
jgi:DNA-binding MarR family transcriptional regulator